MALAGLSIFSDVRYRDAARPLFDAGAVDAIEWSVDTWSMGRVPRETAALLNSFGAEGKLIAHGIHYPLLAAEPEGLGEAWLKELKRDVRRHKYCGISVHFGFSTGGGLVEGAPLPVPYCAEAVALGKARMAALSKVAGCRTGIENLALAFSAQDVRDQGRFIDALLADVDGYVLLDLHNIYCQSVNFGIPIIEIVKSYPLARVEEIHVAGGSWSEHGHDEKRVRRDTHDGRVPDAVLEALPAVMRLCPNLKFVLLEKLPQSFTDARDDEGFRADFLRMKEAVTHAA